MLESRNYAIIFETSSLLERIGEYLRDFNRYESGTIQRVDRKRWVSMRIFLHGLWTGKKKKRKKFV